jgi:hypothetical protein
VLAAVDGSADVHRRPRPDDLFDQVGRGIQRGVDRPGGRDRLLGRDTWRQGQPLCRGGVGDDVGFGFGAPDTRPAPALDEHRRPAGPERQVGEHGCHGPAVVHLPRQLGVAQALDERPLMRYLGRAFAGDGLATVIAGLGGGTGVTTYAENIGVMAMTRVYSTVIFVVAAVVAILLGLSPKFGALVGSIPTGVIGGVVTVLFGLIAVSRRDPQRAPGRDARRAGIGPVGAALMRARRW